MRGRLKGWWHRRAVECAVGDVKNWRWDFYFWNPVAIIFLLLGLMNILSGKLDGVVGFGFCGLILWYVWGFSIPGRMRKATHEERIRIAANEYKVSVEEIKASLEAKK